MGSWLHAAEADMLTPVNEPPEGVGAEGRKEAYDYREEYTDVGLIHPESGKRFNGEFLCAAWLARLGPQCSVFAIFHLISWWFVFLKVSSWPGG